MLVAKTGDHVFRFSKQKQLYSEDVIYTEEQAEHDHIYKLTLASTRRS